MLNILILFFLIFTSFLNTAHSESSTSSIPTTNNSYSVNDGPTTPKEYVVPRISKTHALERIRESKSCREYLSICERSCKDRGDMFKFACIGQEFQPFEDHSRCTCADDLYARREAPKQEQIQVKQEQEPKQ